MVSGIDMNRLARHGVTGFDVLTEATALMLLARWNPKRLPDDIRLTYAIGTRVLRLAPMEKRFGGLRGGKPRTYSARLRKTSRRHVGKYIREGLQPFFVNALDAIDKQQEERQRREAALSQPLPITSI